jgi:regulator of cell morphogenesis and NO signaling
MYLQPFEIDRQSSAADIVAKDYRTAVVFRKHGIGYCCGGKWPMEMTCELQGINLEKLQQELEAAIRTIPVSNQLDFSNWSIDFIIDYIVNIHHQYLRQSLPETMQILNDFVEEHLKKFPWLAELVTKYDLLMNQLEPAMKLEEEVLFPYIRQIAHAHKDKEPYAVLLIKTLRKPVEETMFNGHETVTNIISSIRTITNQYNTPANVCANHKVVMAKLKELDNDLMHHLYLEQMVLFPKAITIEKEVLSM